MHGNSHNQWNVNDSSSSRAFLCVLGKKLGKTSPEGVTRHRLGKNASLASHKCIFSHFKCFFQIITGRQTDLKEAHNMNSMQVKLSDILKNLKVSSDGQEGVEAAS